MEACALEAIEKGTQALKVVKEGAWAASPGLESQLAMEGGEAPQLEGQLEVEQIKPSRATERQRG